MCHCFKESGGRRAPEESYLHITLNSLVDICLIDPGVSVSHDLLERVAIAEAY